MNRIISHFLIGLVISGCATGRTDFKVIKEPTPVPVNEIIAEINQSPAKEQSRKQDTVPVKKEAPDDTRDKKVIVQSGDTLSELCEKILNNAWSYRQVAQKNNIPDPDLIYPNQVIFFAGVEKQRSREKLLTSKQPQAKQSIKEPIKKLIEQPAYTQKQLDKIKFPVVENKAFSPGEKLVFSVEYFGISAGYATLSVDDGLTFHGRPTYHVMATARTHPAFEWIFKVRDKIESYMDKEGLFPWRYEKHLREGSYKNDSVIEYMQLEQKVSKENGKHVVDSPPWTQDVLSEFYYFRALPLEVGQTIRIPVVADNVKVYELIVKVIKKEKIKVPAGTFDCIKVEPYLKFEGLFQHKGKMHIWVTDDKRKVPVLIKSQIVIGTINIVLRDATVVDID